MKKSSIVIAVFLCLVLVLGQVRILINTIYPKMHNNENEKVHLNTGNTIRVMANTEDNMSTKIADVLYPSVNYKSKPDGLIVIKSDKWQQGLSLMPLVKEYKSPIILLKDNNEREILNYIKKINPNGISKLNNCKIILCGTNTKTFKDKLESNGFKVRDLTYKDTDGLLSEVYKISNFNKDKNYGFVISDAEPLRSIPLATWIVKNGGIPLYINNEKKLYNSSKSVLNKLDKVYILGKKDNAKEDFVKSLKVPFKVISGYNNENFAINFAKFYDKEEGVGWHNNRSRSNSNHNFILCSKSDPMLALIGCELSLKGKVGPMLWTDNKNLSPLTENYLWRIKPNYFGSPKEGPFNNIWIIGNENIIPFSLQATADHTQEIAPYTTMGLGGVSGIEALSIIFCLISLLGALWTGLHAFYRMPNLTLFTRIMWILTVLILGPIGLWLYIMCYINSPWIKLNNNVVWLRSLWKQTSVATISTLSFGAATIIVVNYLWSFIGSPLIPFYGRYGIFLFGNPMIIKFIVSYLIASFLNAYLFMPTMLIQLKRIEYKDAVKESLPVAFISITFTSIGMLLSTWCLNMAYSPVRIRETDILWFGFMGLSTFIGFLIAYIPNRILVKKGKKMGIM